MKEKRHLEPIVDSILQGFEEKNEVRDAALRQSRTLIRHCSTAIRAVHRGDRDEAREHLEQAGQLVKALRESLEPFPDLYHAGYTQDGLKEYAEAHLVSAFIADEELPSPQELGVEDAAYLAGLGEAAGELRRRVLDLIRQDQYQEAERLLGRMDEIYGLLVTVDYPDAITRGLRRITDMVRGGDGAHAGRSDYEPAAVRAQTCTIGPRRNRRLSRAGARSSWVARFSR
ncbi:MAG: haloacid dehalogenase [Anaerolineales bacterium]|nr:haloacid dehalogenase [Anaerolineales bacterium]